MSDTEETNALEHIYNSCTDSIIFNNIGSPTFIDSYNNINQDETIDPKSYTNLEVDPL